MYEYGLDIILNHILLDSCLLLYMYVYYNILFITLPM